MAVRTVIDTNVWISAALLPGSVPARLVQRVLAQGLLVFTTATFEELRTRLWKPKFDRYLSPAQRQALLHDLSACAHWVEPTPETTALCFSRDRDDDAFVHAALAGHAQWLVSGDKDLLDLAAAPTAFSFDILTPAQALAKPFPAEAKG